MPLAIADATTLTEAGYIGDDIESVISKLLAAADNDVERAEKGIIFIDEIDKMPRRRIRPAATSARIGAAGAVKASGGKPGGGAGGIEPEERIDAYDYGGYQQHSLYLRRSFPDLENIIKERLNQSSSMGFASELKGKYDEDPKLLSYTATEDLRKFGMIPEFLGRLPIMVTLQALTKDLMIRILTEPKNAFCASMRSFWPWTRSSWCSRTTLWSGLRKRP